MALWRMLAVSVISTMNVLWPRLSSSVAPTRANNRSTTPILARFAGTNPPICASTTASATWRMYVLLPAMFGPVMRRICPESGPSATSFGTNAPAARTASRTGCRPCSISRTGSATISGRQYPPFAASSASPARTSTCASTAPAWISRGAYGYA